MAHQSEITWLSTALDRTLTHIDAALDEDDRRTFTVWCLRRNALIARREGALVAEATAKAPA